jgi:hypothetical protein
MQAPSSVSVCFLGLTEIHTHAHKFQEYIHSSVFKTLLSDTTNKRDTPIQWAWSTSRNGAAQRYHPNSSETQIN